MVERIPDLVGSKLMEDLESTNQLFRNASRDEIKSFIFHAVQAAVDNARIPPAPARPAHAASADSQNPNPQEVCFPQLFLSDKNTMTRLPPDFTLPSGNLQTAWVCYLCWDKERGIPPLRAVFGGEMKRSLSGKFSMYKKLMEAIIAKAKEQNVWVEPKDPASAIDILNRVDTSEIIPRTTPSKRQRRIDQLRWTTLANGCYFHKPQDDHQQPDI